MADAGREMGDLIHRGRVPEIQPDEQKDMDPN
jgi:hypothetical protein